MTPKNHLLIKRLVFVSAAAMLILPGLTAAEKNQEAKDFHLEHGRGARVCAKDFSEGIASCDAHVLVDSNGKTKTFSAPSGLGPAQFRGAYNLGAPSGSKTIAIVDAYNDPNIERDLATYSATYGLPACTTANGCFKKVNQFGTTSYPRNNVGWALEISLDVEVAHGACPGCKILLVEASSNSFGNLLAAEDRAAAMHADVISNSWGGSEFSGETSFDSRFSSKAMPITFSSGDSGFGAEYPAASRYVTAVGGTSLTVNPDNTYGGETAWNGSGSGCSSFESKPAWQTDTGCAKRTVADVSADADQNTGAAVYDSYGYGWIQVGGTSLASPLVAATYALGAPIPTGTAANQMPYLHTTNLFDVTSGSNGSCSGSYLCTAGVGYDGPTGLGSPNGGNAF